LKLKEDFCELCLLVIGSVQQNKSESEILGFIETNLCGRLGSLNDTCVGIVKAEGKKILDELTSNKTVCIRHLVFLFLFSFYSHIGSNFSMSKTWFMPKSR